MRERRRHRTAWKFGALALSLLIFYPLSAGPTYLLDQYVPLSKGTLHALDIFYYPLEVVMHTFPPIDRVMQAYLRWWDVTNQP